MAKPLRGRNDQNPEVSEEKEQPLQQSQPAENSEVSGEMEIKENE